MADQLTFEELAKLPNHTQLFLLQDGGGGLTIEPCSKSGGSQTVHIQTMMGHHSLELTGEMTGADGFGLCFFRTFKEAIEYALEYRHEFHLHEGWQLE